VKRRQRKRELKKDAQLGAAIRKHRAAVKAAKKKDAGRLLGGRW
jgi:hypothetical protein